MVSLEYVALAVWIASHGIIGYTLGRYLFDRPLVGLVGGVAADADFLFPGVLGWPFVHRGITHTLLIGGLVTGLVAYRYRRAGLTIGVTYASHLLIDVTTPKGIPYLYPFVERNFYFDLWTTGHSPIPTVMTWVCGLGVLWLMHTDRIDAPRF